MPRQKKTRNPFGNIRPVKLTIAGKKVDRYYARRRYTNAEGDPGEKFKTCRSRDEAKTALSNFDAEIKAELAGETKTAPAVHTFYELCDYFKTEYIKPPVFVGNKQLAGYRQHLGGLRTYVEAYRAFFGDLDVKAITYEMVFNFTQKLATTPVKKGKDKYVIPKPSTINRKLAYLRRVFSVAIQLGWLDKNPFKLGKRLIDVSAEEPSDRALELGEEVRLLAACEGPEIYEYTRKGKTVIVRRDVNPRAHLKPVIIFAIQTGMRKKEMFTTRRSQLDFERHVITLNPMQTKALKKRRIPMSDRLEEALREMLAKNPFGRDDYIFAGLKDCDTAFATACRRAGIEGLTFHGLRHTASTNSDEAGVSEAARRNMHGWTSTRVSQRYVNTTDDVLAASRVKLNEFNEKREEKLRLEAQAQEAAA